MRSYVPHRFRTMNAFSHWKKPGILEEMSESRSVAGTVQDKSGIDCCTRKKKDKQQCSFQNKMFENKDTPLSEETATGLRWNDLGGIKQIMFGTD